MIWVNPRHNAEFILPNYQKPMPAIKNYTTQISTEKTLGEIQKALATHKATAVLTEYDDGGVVTHVSFKLRMEHGEMSFRLPANIDGVLGCLLQNPTVPKRLRCREQAARVAWRIVKDWIEAQLAIVDAEMCEMAEVFLPYAQLTNDGRTLYEKFQDAPQALLLEG